MELVSQHHVLGAVAPAVLTGDVDPEGYSPLWRIHDVLVEDESAFEPDVIKSVSDIEARGMSVTPRDDYLIAPMVTHDATFMPGRMDPPGGGLVRAWYGGAGVYLVLLANETDTARILDEGTLELATVDLVVTVDEGGEPHAGERPILTSHPGIEGHSVVWSVVHASGGEGYREGRFRTEGQLLDKGWSLEATGALTLGAFVAGPTNTPPWSPEAFDFSVGPVLDEDGEPVEGATVRVLRDIEVLEARTDRDGYATFAEVNDTWNDEDVRLIVAKDGYVSIDIPAQIRDYERFVPSGGVLPDLVSEGGDDNLSEGSVYALVGMLAVAVVVMFALISSRSRQRRDVTEDEVDEIFSEDGARDD